MTLCPLDTADQETNSAPRLSANRYATYVAENKAAESICRDRKEYFLAAKSCSGHNIAALFMSQLQIFSTSLDRMIGQSPIMQ